MPEPEPEPERFSVTMECDWAAYCYGCGELAGFGASFLNLPPSDHLTLCCNMPMNICATEEE